MKTRAAGLVQIGEDRRVMDVVPHVNGENIHGMGGAWMIKDEGTWVPLSATPVETQVLSACNGSRTVRQVVEELERQGLVVTGREIARVVATAVGKDIQWAG